MDFFTAGIALIATQLCMALVMAGVYFMTPHEKCTRYWALAEGFLAAGVLLVVVNAGAPRYAVVILGNGSMVFGSILQWWGIQAFYGKPPGKVGWLIGAAFSVLFLTVLVVTPEIAPRVLVLSSTLLILLLLTFHTLWKETRQERMFGVWLVLGAATLLIANNILRIGGLLLRLLDIGPTPSSFVGVFVTYLTPLIGILIFAAGLLMMYFERMVKEKHHLATHDELTGLLNRRAIVIAGEREIAVATRNRQPLAVAFADIDFFKRINDQLGHEAGDTVLMEITQLLKKSCRDIDLVGRYGGEEFCIIFPGVDALHSAIVGERLVAAIRQYRFRGRYPVTVSVGMAALAADDPDRSWSKLVSRADTELYRAKNLGRNRVCIAQDAASTPEEEPCRLTEDA